MKSSTSKKLDQLAADLRRHFEECATRADAAASTAADTDAKSTS